jgi:hypothetical protein
MEYYLLSVKWLTAWKKHVGFKETTENPPENPDNIEEENAEGDGDKKPEENEEKMPDLDENTNETTNMEEEKEENNEKTPEADD